MVQAFELLADDHGLRQIEVQTCKLWVHAPGGAAFRYEVFRGWDVALHLDEGLVQLVVIDVIQVGGVSLFEDLLAWLVEHIQLFLQALYLYSFEIFLFFGDAELSVVEPFCEVESCPFQGAQHAKVEVLDSRFETLDAFEIVF